MHQEVCRGAVALLGYFVFRDEKEPADPPRHRDRKGPTPIAIVGIACHLPGASDLVQYCANILRRYDAIKEVLAEVVLNSSVIQCST